MRAAVLGLVAAIGCDRGHHREDPPAPIAVPEPPPAAAGCTLSPITSHYPAAPRVVAIGDLHGDLGGARSALRAAGAIDERDHWSGGKLVVVQTGDVLDRGDDERAILALLAQLADEAAAAGGALIELLGNHELMNAAGDFRYVTRGGFRDFDEPGQAEDHHARAAAFAPGGSYAKRLARLGVIALVGDTVYSHAGLVGDWATQVDEVNQAARCWLDGQGHEPPSSLTAEEGPVWTRAFGGEQVDCGTVDAALDKLHAARMVVGHTVQPHGISSACDGKLWRIDVGLGKEYGGPIEVLELTPGGAPKVIPGPRL